MRRYDRREGKIHAMRRKLKKELSNFHFDLFWRGRVKSGTNEKKKIN